MPASPDRVTKVLDNEFGALQVRRPTRSDARAGTKLKAAHHTRARPNGPSPVRRGGLSHVTQLDMMRQAAPCCAVAAPKLLLPGARASRPDSARDEGGRQSRKGECEFHGTGLLPEEAGNTPRYRRVVANSGPADPRIRTGTRTDRVQIGDRHHSTGTAAWSPPPTTAYDANGQVVWSIPCLNGSQVGSRERGRRPRPPASSSGAMMFSRTERRAELA